MCEDNGFAATTRTQTMTAGPGSIARAESLGVPALDVDGNDVLAVDEAAAELASAIRSGGGPRFLRARTYRLTGHTGSDAAPYRPKEEVEARWKDDPVARTVELLRGAGVADADISADREAAQSEMRAAYDTAFATPYPPAEQAYEDIQDIGDPRVEAF